MNRHNRSSNPMSSEGWPDRRTQGKHVNFQCSHDTCGADKLGKCFFSGRGRPAKLIFRRASIVMTDAPPSDRPRFRNP